MRLRWVVFSEGRTDELFHECEPGFQSIDLGRGGFDPGWFRATFNVCAERWS
jgi:hypothetical protein